MRKNEIKEKIYELILSNALLMGEMATIQYDKEHAEDKNWLVGFGDVFITGDSGFAKWYRKKNKTRKRDVAVECGSGYKYGMVTLWVATVQEAFAEFGIETKNDAHLD